MLDVLAGQRPQLTALEFALLSMTVVSAASGPLILNGALTEFLAPTAAACKLYRGSFIDSSACACLVQVYLTLAELHYVL